ncbi:MAG: class I SAM-dependent methyltransferase [Thiogranum sp.]|nr:class I SAM-dependent methyltransferase [Thiogranum sp.]
MQRIPEAELMEDPAQALAYARADFDEPHNRFVELFVDCFGPRLTGSVVDLGCGPGDICRRFARRFPECSIHGIDASEAMLELARSADVAAGLANRIRYFRSRLPDADLPQIRYRTVISNSLLHHLPDPAALWRSIRKIGQPGATVFVMDLLRPQNRDQAQCLVDQYAANEPEILRNDFFNSLLAAYRPLEVEQQLADHGLDQLALETVSDRHFIVFGHL